MASILEQLIAAAQSLQSGVGDLGSQLSDLGGELYAPVADALSGLGGDEFANASSEYIDSIRPGAPVVDPYDALMGRNPERKAEQIRSMEQMSGTGDPTLDALIAASGKRQALDADLVSRGMPSLFRPEASRKSTLSFVQKGDGPRSTNATPEELAGSYSKSSRDATANFIRNMGGTGLVELAKREKDANFAKLAVEIMKSKGNDIPSMRRAVFTLGKLYGKPDAYIAQLLQEAEIANTEFGSRDALFQEALRTRDVKGGESVRDVFSRAMKAFDGKE